MKLLFYDLETTGFGFEKCAIIQFSGIMTDLTTDGKLTPLEAIDLKIRPRKGKMVDQRALEINGYSLTDIMSFQSDEEAYKKLIDFLDKYVDKYNKADKIKLVGYNSLHFDGDFLRQFFTENNGFYGSYFWCDQIDVFSEASRYLVYYRTFMNNFKLGNVAKALNIKIKDENLHNAFYDVEMTYKIYKRIINANSAYLQFNEEYAEELFNNQILEKKNEIKIKSKFDDSNAWIVV